MFLVAVVVVVWKLGITHISVDIAICRPIYYFVNICWTTNKL